MTVPSTVGILYPGFSAEDDFPRLAELLGPGVSLPLHHTVMVEDAHRADALLDWGRDDRLAEGAAALAPYMSADTVGWRDDLAALFVENLGRWCKGEPLRNVVDKKLGYVPSTA